MTRLKRKKELPSSHDNDVRFGTPTMIAKYRAQRLAAVHPEKIIEVGAGAGFQTAAFAKVAPVVAIDIDKDRLERAQLPENVEVLFGDALDKTIITKVNNVRNAAVFLDPQRPPSAKQRTLAEISPNIHEFLKRYRNITENIAIELPPFLQEIPEGCEREYISIDGKLNRLTIYFGALRTCDVSVVALPKGERIEHNGPMEDVSAQVERKFILIPDAALAHAGISALKIPYDLQGKLFFTADRTQSPFFTCYKILATGRAAAERQIAKDCRIVTLHGSMSQEEQRELLHHLNKLCRGKRRLHLFIADNWYLAQ